MMHSVPSWRLPISVALLVTLIGTAPHAFPLHPPFDLTAWVAWSAALVGLLVLVVTWPPKEGR